MAFVLGHALDMQAIPGGKAKHDTIDSQKIAARLRGGMLPQASVYPAEMRASRDRLRRRTHLMRTRSELLAHVQQTNRQDNRPELGKKIASKANRNGVAERWDDPAVQKTIAVDLGLITDDDAWLTDLALAIVKTAKRHDAHTFYRLRSIPGVGTILALVLRDALHDIHRFPRGQDVVSYGRLVKWAREAAGKRYGTSGKHIGNAHLKWAFSEAAVLVLRTNPAGQRHPAGLEHTHGKGTALTVLAHKLARAVYYMLTRDTVFDRDKFLPGEGEQSGCAWRLTGHRREAPGCRTLEALLGCVCQRAGVHRPFIPEPLPLIGARAGSWPYDDSRRRFPCAAPPPNLALTGERGTFSHSFAEDGLRVQK
jgi:transposase